MEDSSGCPPSSPGFTSEAGVLTPAAGKEAGGPRGAHGPQPGVAALPRGAQTLHCTAGYVAGQPPCGGPPPRTTVCEASCRGTGLYSYPQAPQSPHMDTLAHQVSANSAPPSPPSPPASPGHPQAQGPPISQSPPSGSLASLMLSVPHSPSSCPHAWSAACASPPAGCAGKTPRSSPRGRTQR